MKSKGIAYLLWFFFGLVGVHKFYVNRIGMGILYLFTGGIFGIGWFFDLFTLGTQVDTCNAIINGSRPGYGNQQQNVVVNVAVPQAETQASARIASKSPETLILELPDDKPLSLKEIMRMTSLEFDSVEAAIEKLVNKKMALEVVEADGKIKYNFE